LYALEALFKNAHTKRSANKTDMYREQTVLKNIDKFNFQIRKAERIEKGKTYPFIASRKRIIPREMVSTQNRTNE